jgi:hypothetical protein
MEGYLAPGRRSGPLFYGGRSHMDRTSRATVDMHGKRVLRAIVAALCAVLAATPVLAQLSPGATSGSARSSPTPAPRPTFSRSSTTRPAPGLVPKDRVTIDRESVPEAVIVRRGAS